MITIAHRLATITSTNRVLLMDHGTVVIFIFFENSSFISWFLDCRAGWPKCASFKQKFRIREISCGCWLYSRNVSFTQKSVFKIYILFHYLTNNFICIKKKQRLTIYWFWNIPLRGERGTTAFLKTQKKKIICRFCKGISGIQMMWQ